MHQIDLNHLRRYQQLFPEESATIDALEYFLQQNQQAHREIQGSAWIINTQNNCILLTQDSHNQSWKPLTYDSKQLKKNQPLIQSLKTLLTQTLGIQTISAVEDQPFNIQIGLNKTTDQPYYYYDLCYLFLVSEQDNACKPGNNSCWAPLSELLTSEKFASVKKLGKKWQFIHYNETFAST